MTSINGPINLIRMEGKINNIKKVYYLFIHIHSQIEFECDDIFSKNIKSYFVESFDNIKSNSSKNFDFFLESFPDIVNYKNPYKGTYYQQIQNMFQNIFKFDFKKNQIVKSLEFPNIRFHYTDIRSYFTFKVGDSYGVFNEILVFLDFLRAQEYIISSDFNKLYDSIIILNSQLTAIHNIITNNQKDKVNYNKIIREYKENIINYEGDQAINTIKYIINKIKNNYDNDSIKKQINKIINSDISDLFKKYFKLNNEFLKYLDEIYVLFNHNIEDKVTNESKDSYYLFTRSDISFEIYPILRKKLYDMYDIVSLIYLHLTSIYFIRRSLDKNYINNLIFYASVNTNIICIKLLKQYFNFEITHCYYSKYDLKTLNKKISETNDIYQIRNYFLPNKLTQCIDISNFPKNFE